jgi:hypothetical protein
MTPTSIPKSAKIASISLEFRAEDKRMGRTVFAIAFAGLIVAGPAQTAPLASRPAGAPVPCLCPRPSSPCWPHYWCEGEPALRRRLFDFSG